jgi:hypothetical protein
MDMNKPPFDIKKFAHSPLSMAPWFQPQNPKEYRLPQGKEPFRSWIYGGQYPTQPDANRWSAYKTPDEWKKAINSGRIIDQHGRVYIFVPIIHFLDWPDVLNYNIINLGHLLKVADWDDVVKIDGIHRFVYSTEKHPSYDQLITVYNIYRNHFGERNHPDIK